jgi:AcrR family transcriptional regulator
VRRTSSAKRPVELLDAIVSYLTRHGIADLSLDALANAVGSSPRALLYHFGSSEKMINLALARLRERQLALYAEITAGPPAAAPAQTYLAIWNHMTSPRLESRFRLFFEVYGIALRHPRRFRAFLDATINDWLDFFDDAASRKRYGRARSRALATVVVAGFRGFMLDYCASRDRQRLDHAVKIWIASLATLHKWSVAG